MFDVNYLIITITNSAFTHNSADYHGSVLYGLDIHQISVNIINTMFTDNTAAFGGVLFIVNYNYNYALENIIISITASKFNNNIDGVLHLSYFGGVIIDRIPSSELAVSRAQTHSETVAELEVPNPTITISYSNFTNNSAMKGGIVSCSLTKDLEFRITIGIIVSVFKKNTAHAAGGILNAERTDVLSKVPF